MIAALLLALIAQSTTPQRDARPAPAPATGTIVGVVTTADAQRRPLRRVRVQAGAPSMKLPRAMITGDDGAFRFDGLPAGDYSLLAVKDGYVPTDAAGGHPPRPSRPVTLAGGQSVRVNIALPRGAVITGTVTDVDGLPAQGITVSALSRRFVGFQGEYRYVGSGLPAATTDDRGVYRIYGLPEGEYVVAAQPQFRPGGPGTDVRRLSGNTIDPRPLVMAPVFHPAATSLTGAARIAVRAGEERAGTDLQLQYVPLATVSGIITLPAGPNTLMLTLVRIEESIGVEGGRMTRPDAEGRFTFINVVPGQYRIIGRSTASLSAPASSSFVDVTSRQFAYTDVAVEGDDVTGVALSMQPGLTISGQLIFEGERPPQAIPAELLRNRQFASTTAIGGFALPPIELDGTRFKIDGIVPGSYRVVPNLQGLRTPIGTWWLKSIVAGDRDLLDAPLDIRQSLSDVVITFADRASDLSGSVTDAQSKPSRDGWVIAFSTNRQSWFSNSRRIAAVRPDVTGRYTIKNLPPGDYGVVVTRDLEQGEWFDPSVLERLLPAATPVTIVGTDKATLDLKLR